METLNINECQATSMLAKRVFSSEEPIIVLDGDCECMVAMRPEVLERILFDTCLVNSEAERVSG